MALATAIVQYTVNKKRLTTIMHNKTTIIALTDLVLVMDGSTIVPALENQALVILFKDSSDSEKLG
jgi:hypothetical protein